MWSAGPRKPSEDTDQPVLQPISSSLSLPKGLLHRHALSLGSSLGSSPARGLGRKSPAAGVLDHLQMPIRPGLKFPSRDFGRASKTLTSAPLSPKPSLPKPKASSPRPASPVAAPVRIPSPAAASEAASEAVHETAFAVAPAPEVSTGDEPKRPVRSRFTEEYLSPIVHSMRAEPTRALPAKQPHQAVPAAQQQPQPITVDTQTSTVAGQTEDLPLHGFKRHMSLRDPLMGIEQIYAHPRLGRPTADDVITTAQPRMAELQRRATTDFMLESAEEAAEGQEAEPVEQVIGEAEQAASAAAAEDGADEAYESDFVEDLVKALSIGAADDFQEQQEAAVMLDLDAEMAGLVGPEEEATADHIMLDMDDELDGLTSSAQGQEEAALHGSDPRQIEDSQPSEMAADVDDVLQRVATDVEEQFSADATAAVDDTVASLGQEADSHFQHDQSVAIDSTLQSLTAAVATAESTHQAEAVDTVVTDLTARVTSDLDEQALSEIETVVVSLTQQAEAAEEAEQAAAITTVLASLRAQSAEHYERSDSLAVSVALDGVQSDTAEHFQAQSLATVDEALGGLVGDTLGASGAEQAAAVGETLPTPTPTPTLPLPACSSLCLAPAAAPYLARAMPVELFMVDPALLDEDNGKLHARNWFWFVLALS